MYSSPKNNRNCFFVEKLVSLPINLSQMIQRLRLSIKLKLISSIFLIVIFRLKNIFLNKQKYFCYNYFYFLLAVRVIFGKMVERQIVYLTLYDFGSFYTVIIKVRYVGIRITENDQFVCQSFQ